MAKLVIAASTRAIFDAETEHGVYQRDGIEAFLDAESARRGELLERGAGFQMLRRIAVWAQREGADVDIVVVSRRDPATGLRILQSLAHHGIPNVKGCFTSGASDIVPYLAAYGAHLFLSRELGDVQKAVNAGIPAAQLVGAPVEEIDAGDELRIAFDGDAVLFHDESEKLYQRDGLAAFLDHEHENRARPLGVGPLEPFARAVRAIEMAAGKRLTRIALVTARQGRASERAIRTLESWDLQVDEAFFCGGTRKRDILAAFRPHIFFDDQDNHVRLASNLVASALVPWREVVPAPEPEEDAAPAPGF